MDQVIPWARLVKVIEPFYPKTSNGRPPMGLAKMLRIYFLQQWYNLSDPAIEETLYDSETMRCFVGIEHGQDTIPDESTIYLFRHLFEEHRLPDRIFAEVKALLTEHGLMMQSRARLSMPPLSMRRLRPRTRRKNAIPRCTRPRRATSGISA